MTGPSQRPLDAADWPLVGRANELAELTATVGSVGDESVVITGDAGVGKSRLLAALVDRAAQEGAQAMLVRATRSTATIPFGPFAQWTPDTVNPTTDRLHILRTTARNLLEGCCPTVVAVDDGHLLDDGSAALVLHLALHTAARVGVTIRTGAPTPDAVTALWKEGLANRLELQPLSEQITIALSEQVLGGRLDPVARQRLWKLTGGSPLYVREVLHAAVSQGVLSPADEVWRWRGTLGGSGLMDELGDLGQLLSDRLAGLTSDERKALELVASGEPLPLVLAAELHCREGLLALAWRGLVTMDHDHHHHEVTRLAHPLYGEVLRAGLPAPVVRDHQRKLAAAAVEVGLHECCPLRVAVWLLDSGATSGPAQVLVQGARRALALGDWPLADRLGRAAAASGVGPEALLLQAAAAVHMRGWGQVDELLADLSSQELDDDLLVEQARLRAGFLAWGLHDGRTEAGRAVLVRVADRLPSSVRRSHALTEAAYIALVGCELTEAVRLATEAMNDAGPSVDHRVRAMAVAAAAYVLRGQTTAALHVVEMTLPFVAAALEADPYPDNPAGVLGAAHCIALLLAGRPDEASAITESGLEPLHQHNVDGRLTITATGAGRITLLVGRLARAQQLGELALAVAGPGPGSQWPAAVVAMAAAQRGLVDIADDALRHADSSAPEIRLFTPEVTLARAWVHAAHGNLSGARELASRAAALAAATGARLFEMVALVDLLRLGAADAAAARLAELSARIEGPYSDLVARWAQAAATGDGDALDHASARLEGMGAILLAADAAAGAAAAHRSAGRAQDQRAAEARARVLAARCGGAQTPAVRTVGAVPTLAALTRREQQIVGLAARGFTNREIATHLAISIRTVNAHLHHAYGKLGTSNRGHLAPLVQATRRGASH